MNPVGAAYGFTSSDWREHERVFERALAALQLAPPLRRLYLGDETWNGTQEGTDGDLSHVSRPPA